MREATRARDRHARRGARRRGARPRDRAARAVDRRQRARPRARSSSTAARQLELLARVPRDRIVVAESAIETRAQGAAAELAGANAMLVGSTLMLAARPGREARRADLAAARQGLRPHAPGRRRRRGRGGRRPRRLHPRARRARAAPTTCSTRPTPCFASPSSSARCTRRAPTSSSSTRATTATAPATACCSATTSRSRTVVDLPWGADDPTHIERAPRDEGPRHARGRPRPGERPRGDRRRAPVGGRLGPLDRDASPASRITRRCARGWRPHDGADVSRTFGAYGGRYVPETLIPALDELEAGWLEARADETLPPRAARAAHDLRRPADAAHARRAVRARQAPLPQARGPAPHRRAQAEQRARPGRARAAARQAADRRRDGRRPARRRDRHGLRAVRARLRRLHGLRGHAPPGAQRRADEAARRRGARRSSSARRR